MLAITQHRLTIDDQPGPTDVLALQARRARRRPLHTLSRIRLRSS